MRRAVFLDRDGTINEDVGYPRSFEEISVFPESFEAVRRLNTADLLVIVVTNQSGVGRGWLTEEQLHSIHVQMAELFSREGARIDSFYYCPHWIDSPDPRYRLACSCRKPMTGMAERAAADFELNLAASFMVGDKLEDLIFGRRIGARPILVLTGEGGRTLETLNWLRKMGGAEKKAVLTEEPSGGLNKRRKNLEVKRENGLDFWGAAKREEGTREAKEKIILRPDEWEPDFIARDILEAASWIISHL